jgi:hypothetical protein
VRATLVEPSSGSSAHEADNDSAYARTMCRATVRIYIRGRRHRTSVRALSCWLAYSRMNSSDAGAAYLRRDGGQRTRIPRRTGVQCMLESLLSDILGYGAELFRVVHADKPIRATKRTNVRSSRENEHYCCAVQEFTVLDPDVDGTGWGLGRIDGRAGCRRSACCHSINAIQPTSIAIAWLCFKRSQNCHAAATTPGTMSS